jgi:hypothetical protein
MSFRTCILAFPGNVRGRFVVVAGRPTDLDRAFEREDKNLPIPGRQFGFLKEKTMDRREFSKVMGAVVAGMVAGSRAFADEKAPAAYKKAAKDAKDVHVCKGHNSCKGKGGCSTDKNSCAGKNECKGKGGCASASAKHDCKGKNECKGLGGCKGGDNKCAGKNSCKGKGGCKVPVEASHMDAKAGKSSCKGKGGCKGV